jgi:hypothetical protein
MPTTKEDFTKEIKALVQDSAGIIKPDGYDAPLSRALERYSRDRPDVKVLDVAATATGDIPLASLTGMIEDFSTEVIVEYPIYTENEPYYWPEDHYKWARVPSGLVLRLLRRPTAGEMVRFTFPVPHVVDTEGSTVPASDFYAVCRLGASFACDVLAQHYMQSSENNILSADMASYRTKSDLYRGQRKDFEKFYSDHMRRVLSRGVGEVIRS